MDPAEDESLGDAVAERRPVRRDQYKCDLISRSFPVLKRSNITQYKIQERSTSMPVPRRAPQPERAVVLRRPRLRPVRQQLLRVAALPRDLRHNYGAK